MKLGSKAYSRVLIPNLAIVFVNSVPKIHFLGQIWFGNFKVGWHICDFNAIFTFFTVCNYAVTVTVANRNDEN